MSVSAQRGFKPVVDGLKVRVCLLMLPMAIGQQQKKRNNFDGDGINEAAHTFPFFRPFRQCHIDVVLNELIFSLFRCRFVWF